MNAESDKPWVLELCPCEGGATAGLRAAGFRVVAVDLDGAALARNPAEVKVQANALDVLRTGVVTQDMNVGDFAAVWASWPCQHWSANGANPAAHRWPDLITPGRALLDATGLPWVMENVPKAPLRRDLVLCGTMFGLTATDDDGTTLHLRRHRVFESNVPLTAPGRCVHPRGVQWAGVYGGARKDKIEARTVRRGGYVPPSASVQSDLLGGVPWMTGKGRRECIPPVYAEHVGAQLLAVTEGEAAA